MPILGSIASSLIRGLKLFVDTFNRTTSVNLGLSSDAKATWINVRGTWVANGSAASSSSAASGNNVSTIDMANSTITNLRVDTADVGGVGLAFWVTSANSYYALYPTYDSSSTTTTPCAGFRRNDGLNNTSGMCSFTRNTWFVIEPRCWVGSVGYAGVIPDFFSTRLPECCSQNAVGTVMGDICRLYGYSGDGRYWYYTEHSEGLQVITVVTTTYSSRVNLIRVEAGVLTSLVNGIYNSNTSAYSRARSIVISTSGNTISYAFYSAVTAGGSVLSSGTNTPSSPIKGLGVGVFHGVSTASQGSILDNLFLK